MAKKKPDDQAEEGAVQVRVLMACVYGKVDDVVELSATELADAKARNEVDDDPAAVAFALAQRASTLPAAEQESPA